MDTVKVGIIGIGNIGTAHFKCIYDGEIDNLIITAVCDIKEQKLDYINENYEGVAVFKDYNEMIESGLIDSVIISVPHKLHGGIAVKALERGLNVLVEKPVDVSVSSALKVNKAAEKSGRVFAIMFNQRTNSHYIHAHDLVRKKEIGELKSVRWIITNWYRTQAYYDSGEWRGTWNGEGGGVLINQSPHNLDLLQWICGMPKALTAFCSIGKYHNIEVEDEASLFLEFQNGANGIFITSTGEYPGTNRLEINGTLGKIVIENGVFKFWKLKTDERKVCFESIKGFEEIDFDYCENSDYTESAHKGILQNFTNAILFGEKLIADGIEGVNQIMLTDAAYLSQSHENRRIELPFEPAEYDMFLTEMRKRALEKPEECHDENVSGYNKRWSVRW